MREPEAEGKGKEEGVEMTPIPDAAAEACPHRDSVERVALSLFQEFFYPEARALLARHQEVITAAAVAFVEQQFGEMVEGMERGRGIIGALSSTDYAALLERHKRHLLHLVSPETSYEDFIAQAQRAGFAHAMIGFPGDEIILANGLFVHFLRLALMRAALPPTELHHVLDIVGWRLVLQIRVEFATQYQVLESMFGMLSAPLPEGLEGVALIQAELDRLAAFPSTRAALLLLPDGADRLRVAFAAGPALPRDEVPVELSAQRIGEGDPLLVIEAWFSGEIETVDSAASDPRFACHIDTEALGWRSAAAIPLTRAGKSEAVLVLIGAFPRQFSHPTSRMWLRLLQTRWGRIGAQAIGRLPAQSREGRALRESLYRGGLAMFVQPVCDLATLRPVKIEALARLQGPDGTLLSPSRFLSALGEQDHHSLFHQGPAQGLAALRDWERRGLRLDLSVNITPATLVHPECAGWIADALQRVGMVPSRLTLELLEQEAVDDPAVDGAMRQLAERGIHFAIDDLGSGYSSLKRLLTLPIDVVKIDQSLLRELLPNPGHGIRIVSALVQIGRQFADEVVIEGIENEAYLEVARLLGCPFGQGYLLARPMPLADFPAWAVGALIDRPGDGYFRTWLGALAHHWMVGHENLHRRPQGALATCPLTRFFLAAGVDDPVALGAHEAFHQAQEGPAREAAAEVLFRWLVARIEALGPEAAIAPHTLPVHTPAGGVWHV